MRTLTGRIEQLEKSSGKVDDTPLYLAVIEDPNNPGEWLDVKTGLPVSPGYKGKLYAGGISPDDWD